MAGSPTAAEPNFAVITALPIEFAAMKSMLDNPEHVVGGVRGARQYVTGDIPARGSGTHTVVLALLPSMANNSAAARAALILERFPRVNNLIMVGIAGGAPHPSRPDEHVRLGDLVISGTNGVVQYDYVAEKVDTATHRFPPRPPSAELLEAVRITEADSLIGRRPWIQHIVRAADIRGSARPPTTEDRLAATPPASGWITHPPDAARRPEEPRVFVGSLGSANILLRNPIKRDLMRDKFDLRAFEMEGSGVSDATWIHDSGYLVVRGICDYCDGNKGDLWQPYAAIVAAAYTRGLLESLAPPQPTRVEPSVGARSLAITPRPSSFEDQVADTFRLMHYEVEKGKAVASHQVHLYLEGKLGDAVFQRVVECLPSGVALSEIDAFAMKLHAIRRELPTATGTIVTGVAPSLEVMTRATHEGISLLTLERLSTQLLDGTAYARVLIDQLASDEKYRPDLHIQPQISFDATSEAIDANEVVATWLGDPTWNQLTLLGDVGTGKTFLSHMVALRLARDYLKNPSVNPLPILIDLRNADRQLTIEGLINSHLQQRNLERTTFAVFQHVLAAGRIALILDGFDEMAARVTPAITSRNFAELVKCVTGKAKVLLTCRTHYFKSRSDEEEVILGTTSEYESQAARELYWDLIVRKGFKIAYLTPFNTAQIEEYVERVRPHDAKHAIARMRRIYDLMELSRRPMLLDMIVKSIDKIRGDSINPATLYRVFTDVWIQRDRWRDVLSPEAKLTLLTSLAMRLWTSDATSLHHRELLLHVEQSGARRDPAELLEVDNEMRTASFLIREGEAHYRFAHKSYAEFFIARHLAAELDSGNVACLGVRQRISPEVVGFMRDLLRSRDQVDEALASVLTSEYQPTLSENALFVLCGLRQTRGEGDESLESKPAAALPGGLRLAGAQLDGAVLRGFRFENASFQGASLRAATLTDGEIIGGVFTGADLSGAGLQRNLIRDTTFSSANLSGADLSQSQLMSVDLETAETRGAVLPSTVARFVSQPNADSEWRDTPFYRGLSGYTQPASRAALDKVLPVVRKMSRQLALQYNLEADDLEQEAMVWLIRNLDRAPPQVNVANWVRLVCSRLARDSWDAERRRGSRRVSDELLDELPDGRDTEQDAISRDLLEKLEAMLGERLATTSLAILDSWLKGATVQEIASDSGISVTAIHSRLRRILVLARELNQSAA